MTTVTPLSRMCVGLSVLVTLTACALLPSEARAQTLPTGWSFRNIGSGVLAGRATYISGTYTVDGGGADIWGSADQFAYAYRQFTGDVTLVTRVASLENTNAWAKGGLMIRESLSAGSKHALALVSASHGYALQSRSQTSGTTASVAGGTGAAPVWLKLERRGSGFTAFRSADGLTWTRIGSATISMGSTVYVGLAVTSHAPSTLATGKFGTVQITSPLPVGWSARDVGAPTLRGSASYTGSTFTLKGAGADIWGTADHFTFAYRQVSGDVNVIARVATVENVDAWTKAGVMVRSSLRSDSAHASMFVSAGKGLAFQRRPGTGLSSLGTSGGSGTAPAWIKLERRGSAITAFRSSDGSSWKMIGSETLSLPSTFYVGLAVTSHEPSSLATAAFTNVSVGAAQAASNSPPTVNLTSPSANAVMTAPASITVSASASDPDGTITQVEFYRGSTLIGRDTSSPYSVTWTNVAAGSYSLTAVAVDNDGASKRSTARTITVNNPGPLTTAIFRPSADHSTSLVTYYRVEIFTAGATPSSTNAMATQNVGKPTVVNGECRANIAAMISGLPSGRYFSTVRAVGPGGNSARATSAEFRR